MYRDDLSPINRGPFSQQLVNPLPALHPLYLSFVLPGLGKGRKLFDSLQHPGNSRFCRFGVARVVLVNSALNIVCTTDVILSGRITF